MRSTAWVVYIGFGATVDIGCPAHEVWAVLAEYGRDPEWRAVVLSMSAHPSGCATPRTTTAEVMRFAGRTLHNNGEIVQYVPMPRSRTPARGAEGCLVCPGLPRDQDWYPEALSLGRRPHRRFTARSSAPSGWRGSWPARRLTRWQES